ncbi:MAG: hypothetical protein J0M04_11555 [Verrucomicrobia bacterium]|nr:hypothetical protein [Verrucomicrobiota bacterium]
MKKLTSAATFFLKRVFPVLSGGFAGLITSLTLSQSISVVLAIPIGFAIGLLVAHFAKGHAEYVDKVTDAGDRLLVVNRGLEESIELIDIRVVTSTIIAPAGVCLHLRRDSAFGRRIMFLPSSSLFGFSKLAKSLNNRIQQANKSWRAHRP